MPWPRQQEELQPAPLRSRQVGQLLQARQLEVAPSTACISSGTSAQVASSGIIFKVVQMQPTMHLARHIQ